MKVTWVDDRNGVSGEGRARSLESDTGAFWFFSPNNLELVIKVLDGRAFNGKFGVLRSALRRLLRDHRRGHVPGVTKTYSNPTGNLASVAETAAFEP